LPGFSISISSVVVFLILSLIDFYFTLIPASPVDYTAPDQNELTLGRLFSHEPTAAGLALTFREKLIYIYIGCCRDIILSNIAHRWHGKSRLIPAIESVFRLNSVP